MLRSYKAFWQKALILEGRTRRKDFWWPVLINMICLLLIAIIESLILVPLQHGKIIYDTVFYIVYLIFTVPMFTISVRRFHDIGKGKTIPVIYLVLTLLNPINQMANDYGWFSQLEHLNIVVIFVLSIMAIIFAIGSIVISIMALVYCVQDSEKGTNQYGPNPKEHMHEA
ncbi:DUF805 domain-containing protein [Staphylococcus sp.]|uniref:DUF805 domain-containing protein n=1 Tax=Staphylococcus sp. TaxID=29387 RepID=UPI000EE34431|nr:DUF805 domain-containing protein [Staphylococcus sp.]HBY82564.1 DUF805 domain-containing protein [Staphylococcus sp.]